MNPIRCWSCKKVWDERTGAPLHPESVADAAGFTCAACIEAANVKVIAEINAMRQKALKDLAGLVTP